MLPVLPRWMDTLATHPLTKKVEGELAVDVVVYYTLFPVTVLPVLPRWMDTLATHPLTKKAEGELAVDVVVYYTLF